MHGSCPGVDPGGRIHSLSPPNLYDCSRQALLDYFDNSWTLTEVLFSALRSEDAFYRQPSHRLRHPLIFYYGHPAALYVNKLRLAGLVPGPLDAELERLLEVGVDEMSWDNLSQTRSDWPAVEAVTHYRSRVYARVREIIEALPDVDRPPPLPRSGHRWAILLAIEHERIHLETSSVLIRELPQELVEPPPEWPARSPIVEHDRAEPEPGIDFRVNPFVEVPPGEVRVGRPIDSPYFGWDNEYGDRTIAVPRFRAGRSLICNGEYWPFVISGGYREQRFWSAEGWRWRTFRNAKWPAFWVPDGPSGVQRYRLRLCFETVSMQWSWPVIVNFHEAKAFCAWRSERDGAAVPYRLLTEAEHHRLRLSPANAPNHNLVCGSESPVDAGASDVSGFHDVFGNAWQWCEDHFAALPGFAVDPLYEDFSTPCFDGEHNLIMGGSFVSTGGETNASARFHFRRHFVQHAGIRLVEPADGSGMPETTCQDAPPPHVGAGPCCSRKEPAGSHSYYESPDALGQYLLLHFGSREETSRHPLPSDSCIGFPRRCAALVRDTARRHGFPTRRALDLGCAVGGAVFELARDFDEVLGIDLSARFIAAADTLKAQGQIGFTIRESGVRQTALTASVDPRIDRARVRFVRADAGALPRELGQFDAVLLGNLLCRLPDPRACLGRLAGPYGLVAPGGLVLIASPYTWSAAYTPPAAWLDEQDVRALLDDQFELIRESDEPLVIREHARKFEYIVSHVTLWRRR